jgi:HTH-type transcriptional regulator/antitoxin MqsA
MSIHNSYCKACGEGILTQQNRIREIPYKDTILNVKEVLFECEECGAQPSTTSLMRDHRRAITAAKKQYDELLSGHEIRKIREDLGIDQSEAHRLFGGGPTAFSKYENNDVIQSESMDTLLRLVHMSKLTFENLKHLRVVQHKNKRANFKIVGNTDYANTDANRALYEVGQIIHMKSKSLKQSSSSTIQEKEISMRLTA